MVESVHAAATVAGGSGHIAMFFFDLASIWTRVRLALPALWRKPKLAWCYFLATKILVRSNRCRRFAVIFPGNIGKLIVVRKHLSMVGSNNITRLIFRKRFVSAAGEPDEQGREFKRRSSPTGSRSARLCPSPSTSSGYPLRTLTWWRLPGLSRSWPRRCRPSPRRGAVQAGAGRDVSNLILVVPSRVPISNVAFTCLLFFSAVSSAFTREI